MKDKSKRDKIVKPQGILFTYQQTIGIKISIMYVFTLPT